MTIEITTFAWVPPVAQGYVKDLRLRWALEEAGLPYEVRTIGLGEKESEAHLRRQPFGQVPVYRDETVELFETGSILLRLAERSERLAPSDPAGRARTASWVFAALNSIEPFAQDLIHLGPAAGEALRPRIEAMAQLRLGQLSNALGDKDCLEGGFTVGDIAMTTVLRELLRAEALAPFPNLQAYVARGMARPAFGRALDAQMKLIAENAPA